MSEPFGLLRRKLSRRLALALLGGLAVPRSGRAGAAPRAEQAAAIGALTMLVGGLDTRQPDQPQNTDVFIIAHVDVPKRTVRAVSIPRDLYVQIPNFGSDKITRAHDFGQKAAGGKFSGGAATMKATVSVNFGVEVDGVVLTSFQGFAEIVDAFGGIAVNNPYDVYDGEYPTPDYGTKEVYFPAGQIHLKGDTALEFARTRHQDGDDGRVMRQHLVIRALLERARDQKVAPTLPDLLKAHRKAVQTDLTRSKQLALTLAAPGFTNENLAFGTILPFLSPDTDPNGSWIYSGDWSQIPGYVQGFLAGQIAPASVN